MSVLQLTHLELMDFSRLPINVQVLQPVHFCASEALLIDRPIIQLRVLPLLGLQLRVC